MVNADNAGANFRPVPHDYTIAPGKNFTPPVNSIDGGTAQARHVINLFKPDGNSMEAQMSNNDLLYFKCGAQIQEVSNK